MLHRFILLFLLPANVLWFQLPGFANDTLRLKIITTTDVHGHVMPHDLLENRPRTHSLAQVYSYVFNERNNLSQEVILLDNGDLLQGDPFIYYYNFKDTTGMHPLAEVMNFMGYDAGTVGNHDIEAGHPVYDKLARQFDFPWMGANIIDKDTGLPYFRPYTIIIRSGLKVAVLGLCTPSVPQWLPGELWRGMRFDDMVQSAEKWVKHIREHEKPDLLIGLFHAGAPDVQFEGDLPAMLENASRVIAQKVDGFDVIFTGHDHQRWNEFVKNPSGNGTLLLGGGSNARYVAVADIVVPILNPEARIITGNVSDISKSEADTAFTHRFSAMLVPVRQYVSEPVTELAFDLSSREALFGSAPFVNLIHHIQLDITRADVSFTAPLSFNTTIPAGVMTRAELFKLYRFENQLFTLRLTGKEIVNALEYSYASWMNQMHSADDHLINFVRDENGQLKYNAYGQVQTATPQYNFESAAGITYSVDVSKPVGKRIHIISLSGGKPFFNDSVYTVAVNSYRASGGGGHLTDGAGIPQSELSDRIIWTSGQDLRAMIMDWLRTNGIPDKTPAVNWEVVPAQWYEKARQKDYELLFRR